MCGGINRHVWPGVDQLPYFNRLNLNPDKPRILNDKMSLYVKVCHFFTEFIHSFLWFRTRMLSLCSISCWLWIHQDELMLIKRLKMTFSFVILFHARTLSMLWLSCRWVFYVRVYILIEWFLEEHLRVYCWPWSARKSSSSATAAKQPVSSCCWQCSTSTTRKWCGASTLHQESSWKPTSGYHLLIRVWMGIVFYSDNFVRSVQ